MRNKLMILIATALCFYGAYATDCTVRVTTINARGDGLRLLPDANTPNLYVATVPVDEEFTATVLANKYYTFYRETMASEVVANLPNGASFDDISGGLTIPAKLLKVYADTGIDITITAKPIFYTIRYHAHGDGEPVHADGLTAAGDDIRAWVQQVDTWETDGKVVLAGAGGLHAEGWQFLGWSRVQGQTTPDYKPGARVDHLVIKHNTQIKLYAVWQTTPEEGKVSYPVVLQNGGFESPVIDNYYKHLKGAIITESEIQDSIKIGWSTTASDNMIEIGRLTGIATSKYNLTANREGQQFAELNANKAGLLYQRIATLPHTTLHWGFSHRARGDNNLTEETMSMWIGSAEQIEQARAIYERFANTSVDDKNHLTAEEAMQKVAELAEKLQFTNIVHTATKNTTDKAAWDDIFGDFVVPSERTVTEYAFASWVTGAKGAASSYGNLLDRVYLSDAIPIERYDLKITTGPGIEVYINDAVELLEVKENGTLWESYDEGSLLLLATAMKPGYNFSGITMNGTFVARKDCDNVFLDLMKNGLREDLTIDFVTSRDAEILFRTNGGTYTGADGAEISSVQLSAGRPSYTILEPVRTGYKFFGWRDLCNDLHLSGSSVMFETDDQSGTS